MPVQIICVIIVTVCLELLVLNAVTKHMRKRVVEKPSPTRVTLGVIMDPARKRLARDWDDEDANQVERAYCVTKWTQSTHTESDGSQDVIIRVFEVDTAHEDSAGVDWINFSCADSLAPELHIHTPTTCNAFGCTLGGVDAFQDQPSRQDLYSLAAGRRPFGIIQADRHTFRFYYKDELRPTQIKATRMLGDS